MRCLSAFVLPAALLIAGMPLAGARAQDNVPAGYGVQSYTPRDFHLPEGSGCAGDIARWQAVQSNDYASGNVNLKVYNQIQNEIAKAATLCEAGRDAEARRLVATSKSRHGYPP